MKLDDFVKETLIAISHGVKHANTELREEVNTKGQGPFMLAGISSGKNDDGSAINFDLSITVSDKQGAKGGIEVIGLNIGTQGSNEQTSINKISFNVFPSKYFAE